MWEEWERVSVGGVGVGKSECERSVRRVGEEWERVSVGGGGVGKSK